MAKRLSRHHFNLAVLCLLVAVPVYSAIRNFLQERRNFTPADAFAVTDLAKEGQELRPYLRTQPLTGYFADSPEFLRADFMRLQYAVAPYALQKLLKSHFVITRYQYPATRAAFLQREHYRIVKAYPDAITLLESTK